jgi:hypothetical protein
MDQAEAKLIEIGKRLAAISIQAASAYAAEQAKLHLDLVLSRERLCDEGGTNESLAAIRQLAELTRAHKDFFEKLILTMSAENSAILASLPDDVQRERLSKLAETLNWHLVSQSAHYSASEQWVDSATRICNLVQSCRATAIFGETVQFANDEEFDEFELQMSRVEDAHRKQVCLMNERIDRLSKALAILGFQAAS